MKPETQRFRRLIRNMRRAKAERRALLMCASHCQGGHSAAGAAAAKALDIPFPVTQEGLVKAAIRDGFDPCDLWPWSFTAARMTGKKSPSHSRDGYPIINGRVDRSDPEGGIPGRA